MSRTTLRVAIAVVLIVAAGVAVVAWRRSGDSGPDWANCTSEQVAPRPEAVEGPPIDGVSTETVLEADFPTSLVVSPADGWMYVAQRAGQVLAAPPTGAEPRLALDLSEQVTLEGERGLLGLAVSPDGSKLYVDRTDLEGDTRIEEYTIVGPGEIDPASRRELLKIEQQHRWHNGGALVFGPDGSLYIGMGDGGGEVEEPDPEDDAQRLDSLLGSVLRIDPRPVGGEPYGIPPDNPFVDEPGARPEIWLNGVRNVWRLSIDEPTATMWVADVGHLCFEEINVVALDAGGANLGWKRVEGVKRVEGDLPEDDLLFPVYLYESGETEGSDSESERSTCAVIGGSVYRGAAIPQLEGGYVFGDFCGGPVRSLWRDGDTVEIRELGPEFDAMISFATDNEGELYVLTPQAVERLVPAP